MKFGYQFCLTGLIAVTIGVKANADQPKAEEIIKKCYDMYDASKSFQGTLKIVQGNSSRSLQIVLKMSAVSDGKGMTFQSAGNLETVQTVGKSKSILAKRTFVDDGKLIVTVDPIKKTYSEEPHRPDRISGFLRGTLDNIQKLGGKLKVTTTKIANAPVYKITATSKKDEITIFIDKGTSRFISLASGIGSGNHMEFSLSGQHFNSPIPEQIFAWSTPSGYKKSVNPIPWMDLP